MSTNKFFPNVTINSFEDIKNLVTTFQSFVFTGDESVHALREMETLINEYNITLELEKVAEIVNNESGIIPAMIPEITLDSEKAKNSNFRKRAVYNAITYKQYKLTTKNGKHEIRQSKKALTVRDIFNTLCNEYAFNHADQTIKKEDREKARKTILNGTESYFKAFMIGAYRFENIADKLIKKYSETTADKIFTEDKPSKALAEKQIKMLSNMIGLGDIAFRRVHALDLYKRTYVIDRYHQPKVVDVLDLLQDFIITARYAKNNIELPEVNDKGGIFTADETESVSNIITF